MPINVAEKSKVIYLAVQDNEGTEKAVTASDAILTKDLTPNIGVGDESTDEFDGIDTRYNVASMGNLRNEFSFKTPITFESDATAGTYVQPKFISLARACGFDAVEDVPNSKIVLSPAPLASAEFATISMRRPHPAGVDMEFKTVDARGILGIELQVNQRPFFTVSNMSGSYVAPGTTASLTPTYGQQRVNLAGVLGKSSVVEFSLDGHAICATNATCDNLSGLSISRDANFCGEWSAAETATPVMQFTALHPNWVTEFNPFTIGDASGTPQIVPFKMQLGSTALHKFFLECDECQAINPAEATVGSSNSYGLQMNVRFLSALRITIE